MELKHRIALLSGCLLPLGQMAAETGGADLGAPGLQLAENPPMRVITREPPPPDPVTGKFEIRKGYTLIDSLDGFRAAIKKSNQKIRMKPGIYRATSVDPPVPLPIKRGGPDSQKEQQHIFAVTGSNNIFDLRGAVFETPVSVQSKLSGRPHVSDSWHINGRKNTFIGGYFRNVIDRPYPEYNVTENEFEVCNDGNRFFDCIFVIKGSIPYGYTDFYGKGGGAHGRLNKHAFMSIEHANDTQLIRCKVYQQSFGHGVHFHTVDGALIKDCHFSGTLRPTNDIYKEKAGRAVEYGFDMMFRSKQPIPRDQIIPLTEDGIRSYDNVRNIKVVNTIVERFRGAVQLLCTGDVMLENVTVSEPGDFSFDVSAVPGSSIVMKNCRSEVACHPVLNLTRGDAPENASYELTLHNAEGAGYTAKSGLGIICGKKSSFILREKLNRPLPEEVNVLECGGKHGLIDSTVENLTNARLVLGSNVRNCTIRSIGPVEDNGKGNKVVKLEK